MSIIQEKSSVGNHLRTKNAGQSLYVRPFHKIVGEGLDPPSASRSWKISFGGSYRQIRTDDTNPIENGLGRVKTLPYGVESNCVGASTARPRGRVYGFASSFGEYEIFPRRTCDARPYDGGLAIKNSREGESLPAAMDDLKFNPG